MSSGYPRFVLQNDKYGYNTVSISAFLCKSIKPCRRDCNIELSDDIPRKQLRPTVGIKHYHSKQVPVVRLFPAAEVK